MSFEPVTAAIAKLFLVGSAGYVAVRFAVLDERAIRGMSRYVIYVSLPCLIIETLGRVLRADLVGPLLLCFAGGALIIGAGLLVAAGVCRVFLSRTPPKDRGIFLSLSSMHNSGYLPIPLVAAILPEGQREEGLLYTFIFILIMGLLFWSLGIRLISGASPDPKTRLRRVLNPPIVTILLSFLFLVPVIRDAYGQLTVIRQALDLLGQSTIPLVLIILGGSLAERLDDDSDYWKPVLLSTVIRLLIVPWIILMLLRGIQLGQVLTFTVFLQACMPAATNHIVVVREYGGNAALVSRSLMVQYLVSAITVPLFLHLI